MLQLSSGRRCDSFSLPSTGSSLGTAQGDSLGWCSHWSCCACQSILEWICQIVSCCHFEWSWHYLQPEHRVKIVVFIRISQLPNASSTVLASRICCSTHLNTLQVTRQRYCRMNLVVSVFPAPLSPLMMQDWFFWSSSKCTSADSATANTCGGMSAIFVPLYWLMVSYIMR